jgi:4-amino-4-deoxy-L-arabinose transferase-like glycosyltransferase
VDERLLASLVGFLKPGPGPRRPRRAAWTIVLLALVGLGAAMIAHAKLDPDESQHLHAAWLIAQGRVPYRDFWEHHMPLLPWALAPVTRWFAEGPAVYFAARAIMAVTAAAALGVVYVLGGHLGPGVGAAAVILLALQVRFLQHGVQVRPDVPALLTWLVTVWLLVRWRERGRIGWLWAAGLALGGTAALTPKAAFLGVGVLLLVLSTPCDRSPVARCVLGRLACLAAGCAAPLGIVLGWLAAAGGTAALGAFVQDVVVANLGFPDFVKQTAVGAEGIGFVLLGLAGAAMTLRKIGWRALQHPVHGPLLVPTAALIVILLLPRTPAVYSYTWLPVMAIGSLYAGQALLAAVDRAAAAAGRRATVVLALIIIAVIIVPLAVVCALTFPRNRNNEADLVRMRRELAYACPGEAVLDARALAVFRPTALRYPSLVRGLRTWIERGVISSEALAADLDRARAPVGVSDSRLHIEGPVSAFIARHYVRQPDGLLVAGADIAAPGGAGDADVDLLVPGRYEVTVTPGLQVTIDGASPTPPATWLGDGRHRISWNGPAGAVRLTIAPCALRRARSH